jgi:two-component system, NtrC family, sensor kinase
LQHRREPAVGDDMQRRGESEQPVKGRRNKAPRPKARKAPSAHLAADYLPEQFDRLKRERDEALEQLAATSEVLKIVSRSTSNLSAALDMLLETACRLCEADIGTIRYEEGAGYRLAATFGCQPEWHEHFAGYSTKPDRSSVFGQTILKGSTVHIRDVLEDPDYARPQAQKLTGLRAALGVPLMRDGHVFGVVNLFRTSPRVFTQNQIDMVETFAAQATVAIENARLFDEVQARTRELAKSLEELRTTQDRLVQTQKLALLGQLTAGIAHEIKNPLNFVNNFSGISAELIDELQDALKNMPLDDKARADINELTGTLKSNFDKVVHHGRRADAIVKNMLQHSREGSGEHRVVDINGLVEESLNLAWHGARAEGQGFEIKLKQSFDPSAGEADIFPQDIRRALLNMISNGFYAATMRRTQNNGGDYEPTLKASTKNLGDQVEISIRDNGTGMPPDVKEKMFNPFFTTKPTGEGTGLGLSISHDIIVKQHGGSIEVETQPGEFTEIRVILPRVAVFV